MAQVEMQEMAALGLRRLRRDEFERCVAMGLFADERVELLHGWLVEMSPQNAPHAHVIALLGEILTLALHRRARVRAQSPLALGDDSEPEPDLAIVPLGDYRQEHPTTALLVVEVADSTHRKDRLIKAPLYAAAGIPEYWLVLPATGQIEVYRTPEGGRYTRLETFGRDAQLALGCFPDVVVAAADFLP